jgi:hypothetical protein
MIRPHRAWLGLGALTLSLGACQLVSGLSSYQESGSSSTTTGSSSTTTGTGGGSTTTGMGGGSTTTGTGGSTTTTGTGGSGVTTGTGGSGATTGTGGGSTGTGGCSGTSVQCPGEAVCVDLMTDPKHCGTCDALCKDPLATCAGGHCQPAVVGGPYVAVSALSANDNGVCWAFRDHPTKLRLACRALTSSNLDTFVDVALPTWTDVGGVAVGPLGDRAFVTRNEALARGLYLWTVGDDAAAPLTLLHEDATLKVAGAVVSGSDTKVRWVAKDGDNQWTVFNTPSALPDSTGIDSTALEARLAWDGVYVYWSSSAGLFKRVPKNGGVPQDLKATFLTVDYLASDGNPDPTGYLYWISNGVSLQRVLKDVLDPAPVTETSTTFPSGPVGLAVAPDGGTVYWVEGSACSEPFGKLVRLTWGDGPEDLAGSLSCPRTLGLGGDYLYYSAGDVGNAYVYRVHR